MDIDQLSGHAGRLERCHGRARPGDHRRPAELGRLDQRRPTQAPRRRLRQAPAEPTGKKVSDDLRAVLSEQATKTRFEDTASYINPMSPAELLAYIRTEQALWKPVIGQITTFKAAPK